MGDAPRDAALWRPSDGHRRTRREQYLLEDRGRIVGRASERLLDTYESERRPQVEAIIRYSIGRLANIRSRSLVLVRDILFSALNPIPPIRRFFSSMRYMPKPWLERGVLVRHRRREDGLMGRLFPRLNLIVSGGWSRYGSSWPTRSLNSSNGRHAIFPPASARAMI
jgi:hypothetical protein